LDRPLRVQVLACKEALDPMGVQRMRATEDSAYIAPHQCSLIIEHDGGTSPPPTAWTTDALREVEANFLDERSSAWLYRALAERATRSGDEDRARLLRELTTYEDEHAGLWARLLQDQGRTLPKPRHLIEHRLFHALAHIFGMASVMPLLHKAEVDGIAKYRGQAARWDYPGAEEAFSRILPEEIGHEFELFRAAREIGATVGSLRSVVLGANDGMASILPLVAGVAGATGATTPVLIAGAAGLLAGAASPAGSNYASVRAEQDAATAQARLEREAVAVAPQLKRAQLRGSLLARGLTDQEAEAALERLTRDPDAFTRAVLHETQPKTSRWRNRSGSPSSLASPSSSPGSCRSFRSCSCRSQQPCSQASL